MEKNNQLIFSERLESIYPSDYQNILHELTQERATSFRFNILRNNLSEISKELEEADIKYEKGPFENSYVVTGISGTRLSQTRAFDQGDLYIQSLSSMLPVIALSPTPNDLILDLCASPGSKTSQAAIFTKGQSRITAVENNTNRFHQMKKNLEAQGITNVSYLKMNAAVLGRVYPQLLHTFDKVICDVPCSNMGIVRFSNPKSLSEWHPRSSKNLSFLQKKILAAGLNMLKSGGSLVYSTCTYEVFENEMVIDWALKNFGEVTLLPLKIGDLPSLPGFTSFSGKTFHDSMSNCVRILPGNLFDGFFIALLQKK